MIEEHGHVTAVEPGAVWVQTQRQTTCSGCAAKAACGQGWFAQLATSKQRGTLRIESDLPLVVGDPVVIGVDENLLLRSAVLVYLLPLLGLLAAALLARQLALSEPWLVLSAVVGFVTACAGVRCYSRRSARNPCSQSVELRAVGRNLITVL